MARGHGWTEPLDAWGTPRVVEDRGVMARSLAYLFGAGVALALLATLLPDSIAADELRLLAPLTAGCVLAASLLVAVLIAGSHLLRLWTFQCVLAAGTLLITAAIHLSGELSTVYVMFYVWVTLYAFYFFSRTQAALQLALLAAAYSVVAFSDQLDGALAKWLIPIGTLAVAGALVATLKDRARVLIRRLSDAARTDALTGLKNRRGLHEVLERELERGRRNRSPVCLLFGDVDRFKSLNDRLGHRGGDRVLRRCAEALGAATRRVDAVGRLGGDEFLVVMPDSDERNGRALAERLRAQLHHALDGEPGGVTISFGIAAFPRHGGDADQLMHAADEALYAAKELGRDRAVVHGSPTQEQPVQRGRTEPELLTTVMGLADVAHLRDAAAAGHSRAVARYAELTARELGLPGEVAERVGIGGMLHDVGKLAVPQSVLAKDGPLDDDDWHEIRRHPEVGARILERLEEEDIPRWVRAHHERPDGRGYPRGLLGEAIPVEAQIIAVAEAYDAMTSGAPKRPAMAADEARAELRGAAGSQFDAEVVDAFLRVIERESASAIA